MGARKILAMIVAAALVASMCCVTAFALTNAEKRALQEEIDELSAEWHIAHNANPHDHDVCESLHDEAMDLREELAGDGGVVAYNSRTGSSILIAPVVIRYK